MAKAHHSMWAFQPHVSIKHGTRARPARLELATDRFEVWRSIHLSYGRNTEVKVGGEVLFVLPPFDLILPKGWMTGLEPATT